MTNHLVYSHPRRSPISLFSLTSSKHSSTRPGLLGAQNQAISSSHPSIPPSDQSTALIARFPHHVIPPDAPTTRPRPPICIAEQQPQCEHGAESELPRVDGIARAAAAQDARERRHG